MLKDVHKVKEKENRCNCQRPVDCWYCGTQLTKDGVISPKLVFSLKKARQFHQTENSLDSNYHPLPCGKCSFCQIRKRKDMTVRLAHERSLYEDCCFLTLTYNDEHLPKVVKWSEEYKTNRSVKRDVEILIGVKEGVATLIPSDVQRFIKRLRRHLEYIPKKAKNRVCRDSVSSPIRYFAVGEYGSKTHRPHYHILIFGWKPSDLKIHQVRQRENGETYSVFRSSQIEKLWTNGFSTVCDVGYGVAKYCARYVTKKYARLGEEPSETEKVICPEFTLQSVRNGGIGSPWLEKYYKNLAHNFVTVRSGDFRISQCSVPRYYWNRLRKINKEFWLKCRDEKIEFLAMHKPKILTLDEINRQVANELNIYEYQIKKETI